MVHPDSHKVSRAPWYLGDASEDLCLRLQGFHFLWLSFPGRFISHKFFYFSQNRQILNKRSCNTTMTTTAVLHHNGLGSFPFARRYLGNLGWFIFLGVLRCFTSPGCLLQNYVFILSFSAFNADGCPIRIPPLHCLLAALRSFSQLAASFIGGSRLGIHRMPLVCFLNMIIHFLNDV